MRTPLLLLLLIAGCLTSCETEKSAPPRNAPGAAKGLPAPSSQLSFEQIAQLKGRLDQLQVGMSRAKVLEILDVDSFNVRSWADSNRTGITYKIEHGHTLTLAMDAGDYDATLRWARFDGELWPKNEAEWKRLHPTPPQSPVDK